MTPLSNDNGTKWMHVVSVATGYTNEGEICLQPHPLAFNL